MNEALVVVAADPPGANGISSFLWAILLQPWPAQIRQWLMSSQSLLFDETHPRSISLSVYTTKKKRKTTSDWIKCRGNKTAYVCDEWNICHYLRKLDRPRKRLLLIQSHNPNPSYPCKCDRQVCDVDTPHCCNHHGYLLRYKVDTMHRFDIGPK